MQRKKGQLVVVAAGLAVAAGLGSFILEASAASDAAWEEFRADVSEKCLEASEDLFAEASATVDPFGSDSYGMALIEGPAKGAEETRISAICVYDKESMEVELGGELPRS